MPMPNTVLRISSKIDLCVKGLGKKRTFAGLLL